MSEPPRPRREARAAEAKRGRGARRADRGEPTAAPEARRGKARGEPREGREHGASAEAREAGTREARARRAKRAGRRAEAERPPPGLSRGERRPPSPAFASRHLLDASHPSEARVRRVLVAGGAALVVGIALVGLGPSNVGAALTLGALVTMLYGIHTFGRLGPVGDEPIAREARGRASR